MSTITKRTPQEYENSEKPKKDGAPKLLNWFIFTVLFAFFPLSAMFAVDYFWGISVGGSKAVVELLFASIMISSAAIHSISNGDFKIKTLKPFCIAVAIALIFLSAVLYGGMFFEMPIKASPIMLPSAMLFSSIINGFAAEILTMSEV